MNIGSNIYLVHPVHIKNFAFPGNIEEVVYKNAVQATAVGDLEWNSSLRIKCPTVVHASRTPRFALTRCVKSFRSIHSGVLFS